MSFRNFALLCTLCITLIACSSPEEKAESYYQSGLSLLAEGDESRALVEFKNALVQLGSHLGARRELAKLRLKQGSDRAAFREFTRVVEQDPEDVEALIILSELAFVAQAWDPFERHSDAVIKKDPDNPDVKIIEIARDYRQAALDDDGPAREALLMRAEELRTQKPDSSMLRQVLIDGYLNQERLVSALEVAEEALAADPDKLVYHQVKLSIMTRLQDDDGIEQSLRAMFEAFPKEEGLEANLLRFYISRNGLDSAEAFLRERIAAAGKNEDEPTVSLVQFLNNTGRTDDALAELDTALQEKTGNVTLRALRGSLNFDAGRQDVGIAELEDILKDKERPLPRDLQRVQVTLATMLLANGNEVGAQRLVEQTLSEDPSMVSALKMQARWLIEDDDTIGAVNAMRSALAESPQDFDAMTIMAAAYQRAGQTELMMDFLSQAAAASNNAPDQSIALANALLAQDRVQQAETTLITALRVQPQNLQILGILGNVYLRQDDRARAQQVLNALRAQSGNDQAKRMATELELTLIGRNEGNDKALAYLETLAKENKGDDNLQSSLIQAKLQTGEVDEALEMAEELAESAPDNLSYAYFLGLVQLAVENIEAAEATFSDIVTREPGAVRAWVQLVSLSSREDNFEAMAETIEQGLQAVPEAESLLWAKASMLERQNKIDEAIALYEQIYTTNSSSIVAANNLASLLSAKREDAASLERASLIARRLRGLEIPQFQDTYGWILVRQGEVEEAIGYLESAAQQLPNDPTVQYHLGVAYAQLGEPDKARIQFQCARDGLVIAPVVTLEAKIDAQLLALDTVENQ